MDLFDLVPEFFRGSTGFPDGFHHAPGHHPHRGRQQPQQARKQPQQARKQQQPQPPARQERKQQQPQPQQQQWKPKVSDEHESVPLKKVWKAPPVHLTQYEAAWRIQKAFRGFSVRRSNPISNLRQIWRTKAQLKVYHDQVKDPTKLCLLLENRKDMMALSEGIMQLLFQLDSVQSKLQIVREIRKATVKEIVKLQKDVDAIIQQQLKPAHEDERDKYNQDREHLKEGHQDEEEHQNELKIENEQLKKENKQLKWENEQLKNEKEQLRTCIEQTVEQLKAVL